MRRILFASIYIIFLVNAQSLRRESYIDIPTAHHKEGVFLNLNGSYPVGSENEVRTDINGGLGVSLNQIDATLKWYSGADFSLDISYQILKQKNNLPSVSVGLDNLTYNQYISPIGHDTVTYADEGYVPRPPEVASAYIAATKTFTESFEMTFGLGRGKYVGYGPRSHLLNFDAFFDEEHENIVFGLFGGLKFSVPGGGPSFIIETDGRDANLGIQYETGIFKGTLGLLKFEHFIVEEAHTLTPRINGSFSFKVKSFEAVKPGQINIRLLAEETGKPIPGRLILANGGKKIVDIPSTGKTTVTLDPNTYMFTVSALNYKMKKARITVRPNQTKNLVIKLTKKYTPNMLSSMKYTQKGAAHYKEGKLIRARKELKAALNLYPENKKAKEGLKLVKKAIQDTVYKLREKAITLEGSKPNEALSLWQKVLGWEPDNAEAKEHIRKLETRKKVTTRPKKKVVKKKAKLTPSQIADLYRQGAKEYLKGNYRTAASYFKRVLQADPNHKGAKVYLKKATAKL
ncbi:hypothetical protein KAW18_03350 [candidate division WOR-3 bacterium]|nr:hypothetical protein [candidate division WOR-3 bacterium]